MEVAGKRMDDGIVSELCEPCQEGNVFTQADGYCNDCEEFMCQSCFQNHVKMKVLRNHVLGPVDVGRKQEKTSHAEKCKKHKTESIKYYCRNHDSVACGDCLVFDHRKCEPEFIRDLAKNIEQNSEFNNVLKEVDNLTDFKTEIELSVGEKRKDNTDLHDKTIHDIQTFRADINTWLDNVLSKIEAEEMKIWKENESILSKLEGWIKMISNLIDDVKDEIRIDKHTSENLFIRVIECKSKLSEFITKSVPEIKSNLDIQPFSFEPNQKLVVFKKSENLVEIRVDFGKTESQINQQERQSDVTCIDGGSGVASSNFPADEAEVVGADDTFSFKSPEDRVRIELEKELEQLRKTTSLEKKEKELLQHSYNTLKQELVDKESSLSKELELYVLKIKEHEQKNVLLKQEVSSLNNLNISLQSQLDSRNKEFDILESTNKTRQEQDNTKIKSLQSELKKISENHDKECKRLSNQIQDLQMKSAMRNYQLPDPRAAGFDVGKIVKGIYSGLTGTVTAVDPSGNVDVKWDHGLIGRNKAGAEGEYWVKLL